MSTKNMYGIIGDKHTSKGETNIQLISLCASHISCETRLINLEKMIISVINQTHKIELYISISYEKDIEKTVDKFIKKFLTIHFIKRPNKIAQFRHYHLLIEDLLECKKHNTYVIFTDDDDIWSTKRAEIYLECIKNNDLQTFIILNSVIKGINIDTAQMIKKEGDEYVSICTTIKNAMLFIIKAYSYRNLESLAFDIMFYKAVLPESKTFCLNEISDEKWLYFYQVNPEYEHITM